MSDTPAAVAAFRAAVEAADHDALVATLAADVTFHSPVLHRAFEGRDAAALVLGAVVRVFEDFRYTAEFGSADGHVLMFAARIERFELQGVDILRTGADGLISDLTVMVRPYSGLTRLRERMDELLTQR